MAIADFMNVPKPHWEGNKFIRPPITLPAPIQFGNLLGQNLEGQQTTASLTPRELSDVELRRLYRLGQMPLDDHGSPTGEDFAEFPETKPEPQFTGTIEQDVYHRPETGFWGKLGRGLFDVGVPGSGLISLIAGKRPSELFFGPQVNPVMPQELWGARAARQGVWDESTGETFEIPRTPSVEEAWQKWYDEQTGGPFGVGVEPEPQPLAVGHQPMVIPMEYWDEGDSGDPGDDYMGSLSEDEIGVSDIEDDFGWW